MATFTRPSWGDPGREKYSLGQLRDAQNLYDLTKAQEEQNRLLEEQNRLLNNTNNYNSTGIPYRIVQEKTTLLELLTIISIIPIILGFIALLFLTGGIQAKLMGIKLITGGLLAPTLNIIKSTKKYYLITVFVILLMVFIGLIALT